jgi:uncharacterized protein involved in outer membrane biogenesis
MKKPLVVVGAVVGVIIVVIGAILLYAASNLNSIISERRTYLLQRVSDALGRKVEVADIKVTLGWGVMADLVKVRIDDDPAISDRPFIQAGDAYAKVELVPLLSRKIHVTQVTLKNPEVHIIRTEDGTYNVSTIGKKRSETTGREPAPTRPPRAGVQNAPMTTEQPPEEKKSASNLGAIYVKQFSIDGGRIIYDERGKQHQTVAINDVDLTVNDFSFGNAFDLSLKLAMLSDKQNVDVSGSLGPLARDGALDVNDAGFKIKAKLGPILLARLRAIGALSKSIPEKLSMPDPVSLLATASGTANDVTFHVETDLTSDRVAWGDAFQKPAAVALKLSADGARAGSNLKIAWAGVKLGDLEAKIQKINIGSGGNLSARVDTNRFDIGSLAKVVPALQKYNAAGQVEMHTDVKVADKQPQATGTVTLAGVSLSRPNQQKAMIGNLSGDVRLQGRAADAGPLKFDVGSSHATLTLHANSLQPLNANYNLGVDNLKLAEFVPSRPPDEHLSNLAVNGTVSQAGELAVNAKGSSSDGDLANVMYKDLKLAVTMAGKQVDLQSLNFGAFNGNVAASGQATLGDVPQFAMKFAANGVDIQQALQSQKAKAADMIRGILDGQVQVSGRGSKFDDIKPTLQGNGRAVVKNGKLIGVNVAAEALNKTKNLPQIGDLVPPSLVQRHPELFSNPDTDLNQASLTFALQGPRITTHDLIVQTPDYGMTGDGSFDMDKNIDMSAHLILTKQLTQEIIAEKKNVVYVTNNNGEVDIPMLVRGRLPKPAVVPDVAVLAQRAGSRLVQQKGQEAIGKFLGKKGKSIPGVGSIPFLGGGSGGGGGGGAPSGGAATPSAPSNPIEQFKGMFH